MIIVDGSNLLFRQLSTPELANLSDSSGNHTGAIHGFLNSLSALSQKTKYQRGFIIAWDSGVTPYRRKIFRNYKPNKEFVKEDGVDIDEALLSDINKQFKETGFTVDAETGTFLEKYRFARSILHNNILPSAGCISIRVSNCEADDIISVLVRKLKEQENITILSSDRDLNQLLDDNVDQFDGIKKEFITRESLIEKFSLDPNNWRKHWLYIKALLGDGADGIPGFAKLGEVAAKHYAKQILANEAIDFSKLEKAPRTPAEGLISLINDPQRFWDNTKLMNLDYIFETNDPLLEKINIGILKSNIFDIDEFGVKGKLQEFQMRTACNFIQHIIESNENNPLKDYIRLFLN
jgi:DNA polymerase-1